MKIAKIVKSNSHVDYVGRVIDRLDVDEPPRISDYGFAQFVRIPLDEQTISGIIYDTQLANPEYAQFGPRLSPTTDLRVLSPDYLNEQGVLVGILLLGWRERSEPVRHSVPRPVIPAGADVYRMTDEETDDFHKRTGGELQLHYYSQVIAHAGAFAVPLIEAIVEQLEARSTPEERQRLCVLKKSLVWQRTMNGVRL